ncbi:hypothetical protein F6455_13465 [Proteobacteria bacterium 005FR1]|nr:hypothetical protein [Proteobacteria bacterium 005FR1]
MGQEQFIEEIRPGDTVTVENTRESPYSIRVCAADGTQLNMALQPGQMIEFSAGQSQARILLRDSDPSGLLVVQPHQAT